MKVKIGPDNKDVQVFCDMKNGGWTVIMRRSDGSMDFFKGWKQYKNGFGGKLTKWRSASHYKTKKRLIFR